MIEVEDDQNTIKAVITVRPLRFLSSANRSW